MLSFRERNPLVIGAVGLGVIALLLLAAFNVDDLPLIGGGDGYRAAFSEAGGLKQNDEVRVAGAKVGKETGAMVKIKTVLGQKYLALLPKGPELLRPGAEIPLDRTVSAYDVVQAFSDLATTTEQIDTAQLAVALNTIAGEFKDSPQEVRAAIRGLSRLSRTVASRDRELNSLLRHANGVTKVLADRDQDLASLVKDGNLLLAELDARHAVIHQLLVHTAALAQQLSGLVDDNQAQIGPALDRLHAVLDILERNQANLERSIQRLVPFVRVFANTLGNGRWFDTYVENLVPVPGTVQSARPTR